MNDNGGTCDPDVLLGLTDVCVRVFGYTDTSLKNFNCNCICKTHYLKKRWRQGGGYDAIKLHNVALAGRAHSETTAAPFGLFLIWFPHLKMWIIINTMYNMLDNKGGYSLIWAKSLQVSWQSAAWQRAARQTAF